MARTDVSESDSRPRAGVRPPALVDISPRVVEAAMREGHRLRAEAARNLLFAAGAVAARLWRRAGAMLGAATAPGRRAPRSPDPAR